MSSPGITPVLSSCFPVSYASETDPRAHWDIVTITTPLSHASRSASMRSLRCGALPAPKDSSTTPLMCGARNARTVAAVIPGKIRRGTIDMEVR